MEDNDSQNDSAYSSYACPYGIGSAEGQMMGGTHEQYHTKNDENKETANPKSVV